MNFTALGLRTDNIKSSIFPYSLTTTLFVIGSFLVIKVFGKELVPLYRQMYPFVFLSIVGSVLQEVIFRGILMYKLRTIYKNPVSVILLNSFIFTLFHFFVPQQQLIIVPLAFIGGIFFSTIYYYYPNLFLVSIMHVIVNLALIPYCYSQLIRC